MATPTGTESTVRSSSEYEFPVVVANTPYTSRERRIALGIIVILSAAAVAVTPVATVQLVRLDAFVPALQTSLCGAELITALLLFGQYAVRPQYGLLALASGYIASGLFAFLHSLAFPGAYAPAGLFGGPDTGAWLYCFWHIGFPLSVIAYAILKDWKGFEVRDRSPPRTILIVVVSTLAAVAAITWTVSVGTSFLPALYAPDLRTQTPFTSYLTASILFLNVISLVFMFWRARTTLDLWLVVALFAALPDLLIPTVLSAPRFTISWYVARGYALITSVTVLSLFLIEMIVLYQRLAASLKDLQATLNNLKATQNSLVESEKLAALGRLVAGVAHEINGPLGVSLTVASALEEKRAAFTSRIGNGNIKRSTLNEFVESTGSACSQLVASLKRAAELINSFKQVAADRIQSDQRTFDPSELTRQLLTSLRAGAQTSNLVLKVECQPNLTMHSYPGLYGQVITNLFLNSVMHAFLVDSKGTLDIKLHALGNDEIEVLFSDDGCGMSLNVRRQAFDPFFTTRREFGCIGLGLHIVHSIVTNRLGGHLSLDSELGKGTRVKLILPRVAPEERRPTS
jgi:signal transduction histidine kinase